MINPDDIKVVQAQLEEALEAVRVRGKEISNDMAPQTIEQAEMLHAELQGALEAVEANKKRLYKDIGACSTRGVHDRGCRGTRRFVISSAALKKITGARFRANGNYEIVLLDRLTEAYREELQAGTETDADIDGVLWPRSDKGLTPKTVCHETALLLYTLHEPGRLPAYVHARFGAECNQAVAELVLDGVLEIDDGDGSFVSGPDAHGLIYDRETLELGVGKIPELSRLALHFGQLVPVGGSAQLSARLYTYNTVPISAKWRGGLPTSRAVERVLGLQTGSSLRHLLAQRWVRVGD